MKRTILAVAVALMGVACTDNPVARPSIRAAGTYELVKMGGGPLPYVMVGTNDTTWFESGSFTLSEDGRFVKRLHTRWRLVGNEVVSDLVAPGSFTRQGDELTLSWDGQGDQRAATLTETSLTVHIPNGFPDEVYRRVTPAATTRRLP